jgi:hypothetical protein
LSEYFVAEALVDEEVVDLVGDELVLVGPGRVVAVLVVLGDRHHPIPHHEGAELAVEPHRLLPGPHHHAQVPPGLSCVGQGVEHAALYALALEQ